MTATQFSAEDGLSDPLECAGLPALSFAELAPQITEASFGVQSAGKPAQSKAYFVSTGIKISFRRKNQGVNGGL